MLSSFWGSERAWIGDQELGSRKGALQRQTKPGPFVPPGFGENTEEGQGLAGSLF